MSKVFICAAIPDELATREEGAVAVATAIEAGDERRARAKFHWQFLEHYPAAQDCAYKFIVCEDIRRAVNCAERNKKRYVKKGPGKIVYGRKGI